jgi:hypothetical protein
MVTPFELFLQNRSEDGANLAPVFEDCLIPPGGDFLQASQMKMNEARIVFD